MIDLGMGGAGYRFPVAGFRGIAPSWRPVTGT
jgi:hypothetical protein